MYEGDPRINYELLLGNHATKEDLGVPPQPLSFYDILMFEGAGWSQIDLRELNQVSEGTTTPADVMKWRNNRSHTRLPFQEFQQAQLDSIYGIQKPITIIDIPVEHEEMDYESQLSPESIQLALKYQPFETVIKWIQDYARSDAEHNILREAVMVDRIQSETDRIVRQTELLHEKNEINVLIRLGAYHAYVANRMKDHNMQVHRVFIPTPFTLSYVSEARLRAGLSKDISDDLAAKVILELNNFGIL